MMDIKEKIRALREPGPRLALPSFKFEGSTLGALLPEQISGFAYGLYEPVEWDVHGSPIHYRAVILIISSNGSHVRVPATSANVRMAAEILKIKATISPSDC
ncbi:hypothetical protein [Paraburkholderia tropica]|uniref:hypothetical protein n=1 Tax=Paraburkholderia tropica TaxID=92647 RepID=UPI002AB12894|nr:hypothetical protein [Paraburkholderia tropica]